MVNVYNPNDKQRNADKTGRLPVKIIPTDIKLSKPDWLRVKAPSHPKVLAMKALLREHKLHSVCEEASCPNLSECFTHGTATFMIAGDKCTRRCPFCAVGHGRPDPLDPQEPARLAAVVAALDLRYVVVTSVDRDDLRDGGAGHFAACITAIRQACPTIQIEVLVPDFRGRMQLAVDRLSEAPPDVFNHNLETVPRLYKSVRPGADYAWSLRLIQTFKARFPHIPTKSGLMLGLGETDEELIAVLHDLRAHDCDMLTLGQYLQPSPHHSPVMRYVSPTQFQELANVAKSLGFSQVASGPLVRSSYHADLQSLGDFIVGGQQG